MDLNQVLPKKASFKIKATGDHEHVIGHFSIECQAWIEQTFGKNFYRILGDTEDPGQSWKMVRIAYRLLEDKSPFAAKQVRNTFDEDGNPLDEKIGGAKLMAHMMETTDFVEMMHAVSQSIASSNPPEKKTEPAGVVAMQQTSEKLQEK